MEHLEFDPLERLIKLYRDLEEEDQYWKMLRRHEMVEETSVSPLGVTKKKRKYSIMAHTAVMAQMAKIGNDLMRYKYSRVPENTVESDKDEIGDFELVLTEGDYEEVSDDGNETDK
jgi:hypothetical protein